MNDLEKLPCVHLSHTLNESYNKFREFTEAYSKAKYIKSVNTLIPYRITFKDDSCMYFMSTSYYETWCKGRTYTLWNVKKKIYRSGYEL